MRSKRVVDTLVAKIREAYNNMRGIRKGKVVEGVFERLGYLTADQIRVSNYPRKPSVAFNPSAVLVKDTVHLFIRLVFDYYDYVSSIAHTTVPLDLLEKLPQLNLDTKIVIYPTTHHEIKRGAEDPRAHLFRNDFLIFYTAVGLRDGGLWPKQGYAILDREELNVVKKGVLYLSDGNELFSMPSWKNTIMINDMGDKIRVFTRPFIEGHEVIWNAEVELGEVWTVPYDSMEVLMVHENWELKLGVSTPPIQIGSNELLFGWHAVRSDLTYYNGVAVVNKDGELLGISEYLLVPSTIEELYGDRPMVIYGSGLIRRGNDVFWLGGVADYGIGVYRANLNDLLEHVIWLAP